MTTTSRHGIESVQGELGARGYVCDRSLATSVFLALELGRPLLLEGEAVLLRAGGKPEDVLEGQRALKG